MRIVCKKDRKRLGACVQCGTIPENGFSRKVVNGVDIGPQGRCDPCRKHWSEHRARKRKSRVIAEGQCTQCLNQVDDPQFKTCARCRTHSRKNNSKESTKIAKKRYEKRPENKVRKAKLARAPHRVSKKREWEVSDRGKSMTSASNRAGYKRKKKDPAWYLDHKLCVLVRMSMKTGRKSKTVRMLTGFASPKDLLEHLKTLFLHGMTSENNGRGKDKWHIGHRIARAMYSHADPDDVRRCWNRTNIFPQWETDNLRMSVQLPPDEELLKLRLIWPLSWNDQLPSPERRVELERVARRGHVRA